MTQKEIDILAYGIYIEDANGERLDPADIRVNTNKETQEKTYYLITKLDNVKEYTS